MNAQAIGVRPTYVVGVDFGTLSGRALVVRVSDGAELGSAVHEYAHAVVTERLPVPGTAALPPDWALQVPEDYREVLRHAVPAAVAVAGIDPGDVIGIATDFTACTVLPTTADGVPLCELPQWADRPHAWVKLWRHHAAQAQADRINALASERGEPWLQRYGGLISSEWEFAKALQVLEEDPEVYAAMDRWVEAADWIVWRLTGTYVRNACTAGYKGILQDGRYPSTEFLAALNPDFADNHVPPSYVDAAAAAGESVHEHLSRLASEQRPGQHGLIALDWHSGNRSVLVDHELSAVLVGETLGTKPEDIYRALIEATAFGTRTILATFAEAGLPVQELFVAGGLLRNPVVMQIYADVTRMPLHLIGSEQGPALGSAMHAAVAAGLHADIHAAAAALGTVHRDAYVPDAGRADAYDVLYEHYLRLHDHFGRGGDDVMHRLRDPRPRQVAHG
jgi:ribulose kinase